MAREEKLNGLALCAGIGGLELGLKLVLGDSYRTVCYVEREAYPAACLVARMEKGLLDKAPVWDDLGTFAGSRWCGVVDIVTAGFPCQPFSTAGKQLKEADERHLWPEIARIIEEAEPSFVFLENVRIRAFKKPFRDLRAMGFEVSPPYAATAAEMGAGHIRRRVFALAFRPKLRFKQGRSSRKNRIDKEISFRLWHNKSNLPRGFDGVPNRVDRDRALGNAVVPIVAAKAFQALIGSAV